MAQLLPNQYSELKNFLAFYTQKYFNLEQLPPELHPITVLEKLEIKSPARATNGLLMAIQDCIEHSYHWPLQEVLTLNSELIQENLVTLSYLRKQYSKQYLRIIKRRQIKSESEYFFLKGICDGNFWKTTDNEWQLIQQLLENYEAHYSIAA